MNWEKRLKLVKIKHLMIKRFIISILLNSKYNNLLNGSIIKDISKTIITNLKPLFWRS
jgi:hypothetical protein